MSNANAQIIGLSKQGFSAAEISESLGYDVDAVSVILAQAGPQALVVMGGAATEDTDAEIEAEFKKLRRKAFRVMDVLMERSEDDSVKAKLAMYVADQQLGLKRPAKPQHTINNIVMLQENIARAKELTRLPSAEPEAIAV